MLTREVGVCVLQICSFTAKQSFSYSPLNRLAMATDQMKKKQENEISHDSTIDQNVKGNHLIYFIFYFFSTKREIS